MRIVVGQPEDLEASREFGHAPHGLQAEQEAIAEEGLGVFELFGAGRMPGQAREVPGTSRLRSMRGRRRGARRVPFEPPPCPGAHAVASSCPLDGRRPRERRCVPTRALSGCASARCEERSADATPNWVSIHPLVLHSGEGRLEVRGHAGRRGSGARFELEAHARGGLPVPLRHCWSRTPVSDGPARCPHGV